MKISTYLRYDSLRSLAESVNAALHQVQAGWNQQHNADGSHATITLTGTATATKQPRVSAYYSTVQSITTATWTALTLDSEDFDTSNLHDISVNNDRVTIGVAGLYFVTARASFSGNTTGARGLTIAKNGTAVANFQKTRFTVGVNPVVSTVHNEQVTALLELRAGDYLVAMVYQDSGGALNVGNANRFYANELVVAKLW